MRNFIALTMVLALLYATPNGAPPQIYTPPPASAAVLQGINFTNASPVDELYRAEFERCDRENVFKGINVPKAHQCKDDPNKVKALLKFPGGAVFFESKLSLDLDGSWKACHNAGHSDQCPTWYEWANLPKAQRPVDSDIYPYVVIPISNFKGKSDQEFRDKTGLNSGDVGVVIYKDKVVPVFVADGGPYNKLGEGSEALFKALGEDRCLRWRPDGHCKEYHDSSVDEKVLFFLFPRSNIAGLTPANALEKIRAEALARFDMLRRR
jgi:hypothetical protein